MRKLLSVLTSVLMVVGITFGASWAANVPLQTNAAFNEPSQILSTVNSVLQVINTNVSGVVAVQVGPINSTATTAEQTLATFTIPAGTLASPGQSLRLMCSGGSGSNTNQKTMHLYYGTTEISSAAFSTSAETWNLQLFVTNAGTQPNSVATGYGFTNTTAVAPIATNNLTDNLSTALVAKCTVTQGTASASDITLYDFVAEQVK